MHIKLLINNNSAYNDVIRFSSIPLEHVLGVYTDFSFDLISRIEFYNLFPYHVKLIFFYFNDILELESLPKDIINKINQDKLTFLMVWNTHEPYLNIEEIDRKIQMCKIKNHKVIVVSSDSSIKIPYHHFFADSWWEAFYRYYVNTHNTSFIRPDNYNLNFEKKSLCLNRNVRPHRIWNYFALKESGLLDQSFVSYHLPKIIDDQKNYQKSVNYSYKNTLDIVEELIPKNFVKRFSKSRNFLQKIKSLDNLGYVYNLQDSIVQYFQHSAFSIVTETVTDKTFISEKTFKAITHCHPFISVAHDGNVDYLKKNGYELYTEFFGIDNIKNFEQAHSLYSYLGNMDEYTFRKKIHKLRKICFKNWYHFFSRPILLREFLEYIVKNVV